MRKILDMISLFLKFLRLVLWSNVWSILENNSDALEKNVQFADLGHNVLEACVKFIFSNVLP